MKTTKHNESETTDEFRTGGGSTRAAAGRRRRRQRYPYLNLTFKYSRRITIKPSTQPLKHIQLRTAMIDRSLATLMTGPQTTPVHT